MLKIQNGLIFCRFHTHFYTNNIQEPERPKSAHLGYKGTEVFFAAQDVIRTNVLTNFHEK